jgi:mannose-6-phosphate isomerase-like protein (cupin superfamily)
MSPVRERTGQVRPSRRHSRQVDGKAPVTLRAGDVLFVPAGAIHSANVGRVEGAELATPTS